MKGVSGWNGLNDSFSLFNGLGNELPANISLAAHDNVLEKVNFFAIDFISTILFPLFCFTNDFCTFLFYFFTEVAKIQKGYTEGVVRGDSHLEKCTVL